MKTNWKNFWTKPKKNPAANREQRTGNSEQRSKTLFLCYLLPVTCYLLPDHAQRKGENQ
jgi:hypothetical protein